MSDDETVHPTAEPAPAEPSTPRPAEPTASVEPGSPPGATQDPGTAVSPDPAAAAATSSEPTTVVAGPSPTAGRAVAFLKAHAATLVLALLLVGAIVWGALGLASTNRWEARATALSSDLTSTEETLADAQATIDDLETARDRAESTATACVGAIDDADAMLEVSAKLDDKTLVYLDGLNDFMTALSTGDVAAAETIGAEIDKLGAQLEDLGAEIEGHIDDYEDAAEGCHVGDAQDA